MFGIFSLRCGTMNEKAGEKGQSYIDKYSLIHFDLVILLTIGVQMEFVKKLYNYLRNKKKHVL